MEVTDDMIKQFKQRSSVWDLNLSWDSSNTSSTDDFTTVPSNSSTITTSSITATSSGSSAGMLVPAMKNGLHMNNYLHRAGSFDITHSPGIDLISIAHELDHWKEVYVILFGAGSNDNEGIYSMRTEASSEGDTFRDTVIVFSKEADAQRFCTLLGATMRHAPEVHTIATQDIVDFCITHGHNCRLEPSGSLLIPPEVNVECTDWERSQNLRKGRYAVLESEPEHGARGAGGQGDSPRQLGGPSSNNLDGFRALLEKMYNH